MSNVGQFVEMEQMTKPNKNKDVPFFVIALVEMKTYSISISLNGPKYLGVNVVMCCLERLLYMCVNLLTKTSCWFHHVGLQHNVLNTQ